jgi:hypothetical protein
MNEFYSVEPFSSLCVLPFRSIITSVIADLSACLSSLILLCAATRTHIVQPAQKFHEYMFIYRLPVNIKSTEI